MLGLDVCTAIQLGDRRKEGGLKEVDDIFVICMSVRNKLTMAEEVCTGYMGRAPAIRFF